MPKNVIENQMEAKWKLLYLRIFFAIKMKTYKASIFVFKDEEGVTILRRKNLEKNML
jgi:hypothetical protein